MCVLSMSFQWRQLTIACGARVVYNSMCSLVTPSVVEQHITVPSFVLDLWWYCCSLFTSCRFQECFWIARHQLSQIWLLLFQFRWQRRVWVLGRPGMIIIVLLFSCSSLLKERRRLHVQQVYQELVTLIMLWVVPTTEEIKSIGCCWRKRTITDIHKIL